ncbi:MAG: calcium-binding protein [Hyphomicrobiaceae bacterium]
MSAITGGGSNDRLVGTSASDQVFAGGGADVVRAGDGDDLIVGGGGNDRLLGEAGNDTIFGASSSGGAVEFDRFRIAEATTATVTFMGETAGYRNAVGMYKIAADGTIYDVEIIFSNASLQGSGGDLRAGVSSESLDLAAGERIGFFIVPDAYSQPAMRHLLDDTRGSFHFENANGEAGNVNDGPLHLVHVARNGRETDIRSAYGTEVFHSIDALNSDGISHVRGEVDVATGRVTLGFEDLWNGGDNDFDDSILQIDIGVTNAALLPRESSGNSAQSDNDVILGGDGDDKLFGMAGDDVIRGEDGNDQIWGNSGNDRLVGGDGDDQISGGSGDDVIGGGKGNDEIAGNSGDDVIRGGAGDDHIEGNSGNDTISDGAGNDTVDAGSGDDVMFAGAGNDTYVGGSGFDTLDFSGARRGITLDLSKHTATGMGNDTLTSIESVIGSSFDDVMKGDKRDNVLVGGDGDDVLRGLGGSDVLEGGAGNDTFRWLLKDVIDEASGEHLGIDVITDLQVGDVIDLHSIVKGIEHDSLDDVVRVSDGAGGATVSVLVGDTFVDVVTVQNYSADDLLASGAILA